MQQFIYYICKDEKATITSKNLYLGPNFIHFSEFLTPLFKFSSLNAGDALSQSRKWIF